VRELERVDLARSIAGLFLSLCRLYSSFSAFKSSSGIVAVVTPGAHHGAADHPVSGKPLIGLQPAI